MSTAEDREEKAKGESRPRFLAKVLLTPLALAVFGLLANERLKSAEHAHQAQLAELEQSTVITMAEGQRASAERIAAAEQEIALLSIYKDQIVSNDPDTRIAAIGVVGVLNNELAERLIKVALAKESSQKESSQEVLAFANKTLGTIKESQAFRDALDVEMKCEPEEGKPGYYAVKFSIQGAEEKLKDVKAVRYSLLRFTRTSSDRAAMFEVGLTMRFCRAATLNITVTKNDGVAEGLAHSVCNDPAWLACVQKGS